MFDAEMSPEQICPLPSQSTIKARLAHSDTRRPPALLGDLESVQLHLLAPRHAPSDGPTLAMALAAAWLVASTTMSAICTCAGRVAA